MGRDETQKRHKKEDSKYVAHEEDRRHRRRHEKSSKEHRKSSRYRSHDAKRKRRRDSDDDEGKTRRHHHSKDRRRELPAFFPLGERYGQEPPQKLDAARDYYQYHQHLFLYLFRKGKPFNDLTTKETHEAFRKFVQKYNHGDLETAYYQTTLPREALEECQTTQHKWTFQTSSREEKHLAQLQAGVHHQTEHDEDRRQQLADSSARQQDGEAPTRSLPASPPLQPHKNVHEKHNEARRIHRRLKEHVRTVHEELTGGRKEGRERQIEKRQELSHRLHAASRERDAAPEIPDTQLYGDDTSDFQAALAREKNRKQLQEQARQARLEELQQKEAQKQQDMLDLLGLSNLKSGQKITIAPRESDTTKK